MTGLSVASVRVVGSAVAAAKGTRTEPQVAAPAELANADSWSVEGIVVDEQGRPVAGAVVRTMPAFAGPANIESGPPLTVRSGSP